MSNNDPKIKCRLCSGRFHALSELRAHERALHPEAELAEIAEPDTVSASLSETPVADIEYLVGQVQGLIDEVTDLVIPHATPDQGRAVLQAISMRVKILADRLDARAIRSQAFKL